MNTQNTSQRSLDIIELYKKKDDGDSVEAYLKQLLENDPNDFDAIIRYAIFNSNIPYLDYEFAQEILMPVLELQPRHVKAWIILTNWQPSYRGYNKHLVDFMLNLKPESADEQAMIYFILAQNGMYFDEINEREYLEASIKACDDHVYNHSHLAYFYKKDGNLEQAQYHYQKAYNNLKITYREYNNIDFTDLEEYLNEYIRGTHLSHVQSDSLKEDLDEINDLINQAL